MVRKVRLVTGLILMFFVVTHLLNHAVGVYSLRAALAVEEVFHEFWEFFLLQVALYGSFLVHMALAAWAIISRRRFRHIRPSEAAQLLLGLAIPALVLEHVIGTRAAQQIFDQDINYVYIVLLLWVYDPVSGLMQVGALFAAWGHGCIGLHAWLRLKPWYATAMPYLLGAALLIPVASLFGFATMGRELAVIVEDEAARERLFGRIDWLNDDQIAFLLSLRDYIFIGLGIVLAATIAARLVLVVVRRRHRRFRVQYAGGQSCVAPIGASILDVSRANDVPHASVCGGRGRCSTCRVRVSEGLEDLPPTSEAEQRVLNRVGAPPNVRLACQTHPTSDVTIVPLLPPTATAAAGRAAAASRSGQEQEVAVLFADMRGFTALSEGQLPFDLVFILNRYFRAMGTAVEDAGGHLDKFIGDGVMAIFGIDSDPAEACRRAIDAARRMSLHLDALNQALTGELDSPMRIGIGINFGPTIVGEMGHASATGLTAIGDTVNTASRLEAMTKEQKVELILAQSVADRAGLDVSRYRMETVDVRGRVERMVVTLVPNAAELPEEIS